jgi:putative transposase
VPGTFIEVPGTFIEVPGTFIEVPGTFIEVPGTFVWGEVFGGWAMRDVPRKPRIELAGGVHHVSARGNGRQALYLDDHDRRAYLQALAGAVDRCCWHCLSYCLMGNHLHLLVETPEPNLAVGMHRVQSTYARMFNRRHGRVGHVFQRRYHAVLVSDDKQLWATLAYIARNPVEAGLCVDAREWEWSSYAAELAGEDTGCVAVDRLHALLGADGGEPMRRYAELMRVPTRDGA